MTDEAEPRRSRTLLLLRHAKSSWDDPSLADHDRPLARRGVRAADRMAAHLLAEGICPALVLCSSARRARDTLEALRSALGDFTDVQIEDGLYAADASDILQRLQAVDPVLTPVLVIGHNPAIGDLAIDLAGGGDGTALAQLRTKYPTGALAVLELSSGWAGLGPGQGHLTDLVLPRQLPR